MKICFNEWQLADRDVNRRVVSGVRMGGASIVKNCKIVEVTEIPTRSIGQRTDPWLRQAPFQPDWLKHLQ